MSAGAVQTSYSAEDRQDDEPRKRPARACTARTSARLAPLAPTVERPTPRKAAEDREPPLVFVSPLPPSQKQRWLLRNMWELASLLNFLHVFRPILNINVEFTAEELETALITPNSTLDMIHIPLLKAIPPVSRTALRRDTWVTVLCKKLKYWWPWVAEGELPLIAYHGEEIAAYKKLDPGTRVVILKALCEIRVEQDDIRKYIDDSLKHGVQLFTFRKERIGGSLNGTSYWYEDDSTLGHRLYREIRKIELKNKPKGKGRSSESIVTYQWETIATNLDEFQAVSEKLTSSKTKVESALGKKLENDIIPTLEELQKRKERALKRQQRQASLLDSNLSTQEVATGRSRRDRKPVKYTFDEYDRSINEAIKTTKKSRPSPEPILRSDVSKFEYPASNGKDNGHIKNSAANGKDNVHIKSPAANGKDNGLVKSSDMSSKLRDESGESDAEHTSPPLTRSNRQRRRSQRYSEKDYVEAVYDNEADFDSDDDIVGEAVYDDGYFKSRKRKKTSSCSDGDEEYRGDDEDVMDAEDDDEDASISDDVEDIQSHRRGWFLSGSQRREQKRKYVDELQSGLRRSKRATRSNVDYSKYEMSDSDEEYVQDFENSAKVNDRMNRSKKESESEDLSNSIGYGTESEDSVDELSDQGRDEKQHHISINALESQSREMSAAEVKVSTRKAVGEESVGQRSRLFLDLNEAAPIAGFDDGPSSSARNQTGLEDIRYSSSSRQ